MKALTKIIIDTRNELVKNKKGKKAQSLASKEPEIYPVKLRVTFNRKQKYYTTELSMSIANFDVVTGKNPKGKFKDWKLELDGLEQKANAIIEDLTVFDFDIFKKKLVSKQMVRGDVYAYYDQMIEEYRIKGKPGTASNYSSSKKSLQEFKKTLLFYEVTVDFLERYESFMLKQKKSISTVGIYLRPLRSVINHAIANEVLSKGFNYPFGSTAKRKYSIPTSKNIKKALSKSELELIFKLKPELNSPTDKALDFWKFSFLANGMNMKDVANLRYKDINRDKLKFVRAKTKDTNHSVTPISIGLTVPLKEIIAKWGNSDKTPTNYIFPILTEDITADKEKALIHQFIKTTNKYMKRVAESLNINVPCTTYYARHSFSTTVKRLGYNTSVISEMLGHSSETTTKAYLDSMEDDIQMEIANAIIPV
jgi:integrase